MTVGRKQWQIVCIQSSKNATIAQTFVSFKRTNEQPLQRNSTTISTTVFFFQYYFSSPASIFIPTNYPSFLSISTTKIRPFISKITDRIAIRNQSALQSQILNRSISQCPTPHTKSKDSNRIPHSRPYPR